MSKSSEFKYSLKRFRRDLEQVVNEKALKISQELSTKTAFAFQKLARDNLKNFNESSEESQHLVDMVSRNIVVVDANDRQITTTHTDSTKTGKNKKVGKFTGCAVKVKMDKQGLAMFLEYGTGLEGDANKHPEAKRFNWEYAVNDNTERITTDKSYKKDGPNTERRTAWYPTLFGKKGFVFKKTSESYFGKSDIKFKNGLYGVNSQKYIFVPPTPMVSKLGKPFTRRQYTYFRRKKKEYEYTKSDYIISSGIKPVMYIYNAKNDIRDILHSQDLAQINNKLDGIFNLGDYINAELD